MTYFYEQNDLKGTSYFFAIILFVDFLAKFNLFQVTAYFLFQLILRTSGLQISNFVTSQVKDGRDRESSNPDSLNNAFCGISGSYLKFLSSNLFEREEKYLARLILKI